MLINYGLLPTLCELGSGSTFAEAARRLRLTPSAISHQMRSLEAQLGFRLFERVGRRAQLTPEAHRLVAVVAEHLAPIDEALEALLDDGKTVRGLLRVGGVLPFSRLWLRPRMARLMRQFPELRLSVAFGPPSVLMPKLQSGLLDLVLIAEEVESPLLASQPVFVEEFWAVCAVSYLAGAAPPTTVKELQQQRFIVYDDSRPMHDAWWRNVAGRQRLSPPAAVCSIANLDEMLNLAEQGVGVAVLPNYLVSELVARGKLLRLGPRKSPQNPIRLVWRKASIETSRFKVVKGALLSPEAKPPGRR